MWFYVMIVTLLLVLVWLTQVRERFVVGPGTVLPGGFEVPDINPADLPPPQEIFKKLRDLLDKYDKPEIWDHATQSIDKDPGQLAREHLGIHNGSE